MKNLVGRTLYRLGERLPGQVSMLGEDGCAATHPARVARFANPWRVVAGLTVCNGPVLFFTSGVFLKPIAADMHWQRSTVSFALSLATFLSAFATPILGRMMDRWGIRAISLPGLPVFAAFPGHARALTGLTGRLHHSRHARRRRQHSAGAAALRQGDFGLV
jgi:MFS family permease